MLYLYLALIDTDEERRKFEDIYYTYREQMYFVAYSVVKNKEDSEDIVHDVFMKIASKYMPTIHHIKDDRDLRCYLLTAVKNTAINTMKKKSNTNVSISDIAGDFPDRSLLISNDDFLDTLCLKSDCEQILHAIKNIGKTYRDFLYFYFVVGLSIQEISVVLNRKIATTRKQLTRGKQVLLKLLEEAEVLYSYDQA